MRGETPERHSCDCSFCDHGKTEKRLRAENAALREGSTTRYAMELAERCDAMGAVIEAALAWYNNESLNSPDCYDVENGLSKAVAAYKAARTP